MAHVTRGVEEKHEGTGSAAGYEETKSPDTPSASPASSPAHNASQEHPPDAATQDATAAPPHASSPRARSQTSVPVPSSRAWDAHVPLCITFTGLADRVDRRLPAVYVNAARVSYLAMLLHRIETEWLPRLLLPIELQCVRREDCWFEHRGSPLRWQWPLGLLYDFHTAASAAHLPWALTLHFDPPAARELLATYATLPGSQQWFMARVKEAEYVRWGTCKRVLALPREDQDMLWHTLQTNDHAAFERLAAKLVPGRRATAHGNTQHVPMRRIPIRFYTAPHAVPMVESPMAPTTTAGVPTTLADALESVRCGDRCTSETRAVLHGITLPPAAELAWLAGYLAYADGW
ncbi:autophagy protein 5 [Malassezia sp. CBS 17886]|nr:autophagy protein 5 [Malassezia sp. CBS 17886]